MLGIGEPRFDSKLELGPDGCWLWTASQNGAGYGQYSVRWPAPVSVRWKPGKPDKRGFVLVLPHRYAYVSLIGTVPEGLELDHLCRVRHCANPEHLEIVTPTQNKNRTRKTHCIHGHELTEENTVWFFPPSQPFGIRGCIQCRRRFSTEARQRRKERNANVQAA